MHYNPCTRNIILDDHDLTEGKVQQGWDLAVADGVAITTHRIRNTDQPVKAIPRDRAEAYLPGHLVTLVVRLAEQEIAGDTDQSWAGWHPEINDEVEEW